MDTFSTTEVFIRDGHGMFSMQHTITEHTCIMSCQRI